MKKFFLMLLSVCVLPLWVSAQKRTIVPGAEWPDNNGLHINAHGGNIIQADGTFFWYGESRPRGTHKAMPGISLYTSTDLVNWKDCGIVLSTVQQPGSPIEYGCVMERPKVVFCPKTQKYVMLFHLELKGKGYSAAMMGFAQSDSPYGPFKFERALRPNAKCWPVDFKRKDKKLAQKQNPEDYKDWWTPEWRKAIEKGMFLWRDFQGGQMSRDQTVYVDDDGTAYQLTSSEDNLTLHLNELTSDFLGFTGRFIRIAPGGQNEAPTLMKNGDTYWMITSGCTGWAPNEARMFSAKSLWGPWTQHPSPCIGPDAKKTFGAQGTYILKHGGRFIFMADRWMPKTLSESRHVWLPIEFGPDGTPQIIWRDKWDIE